MNKEQFWNSLSKNEKEMVSEILKSYSTTEGMKDKAYKLFSEGSSCSISENNMSPSEYVRTWFKGWLKGVAAEEYNNLAQLLNN